MTPKQAASLEQCLPEGQLVNRAWAREHGFSRPRVDYALRTGKLEPVAHGVYRRPGPALKWEHVVYSLNEMGCHVTWAVVAPSSCRDLPTTYRPAVSIWVGASVC
jgi:hypothetical protein